MSSISSITLATFQPDTAAQFVVIDGKPVIRMTTSSEAAELSRLDAQIDHIAEKMERLERELDGYDYRLVRNSSRCHKLIALQDELEALGDRLSELETKKSILISSSL
jgi:predicted RNase H-like nuclease (RuvC/YqgF family)